MIETDRLLIREFIDDDFDDFWEIFSNNKVTSSYGLKAFDYKREAFRFFEKRLKKPLSFAIVLKPSMKLIGEISLNDPVNRSVFQFANTKEMGVIANDKFQKHGYMTEGGKAIIKHCFDNEDINAIYCRAFSYNIPSIKFSKKCGMKVLFKRMESLCYSNPEEIVTSAITKDDYLKDKLYESVKFNIVGDVFNELSFSECMEKKRIREKEIETYDKHKFQVAVGEIGELLNTDDKKQLIFLDKSF